MEGFHLKSGLKAVQKNPTLIIIKWVKFIATKL